MNKKVIAIGVVVAILVAGVAAYAFTRPKNDQSQSASQPSTAPTNEPTFNPEETPVELDINTQEFTLTGSNISCSTTTINGQTTHNCTGAIYIVPTSNPDHDPGLYKINEQTRLLKNGEQQDLQTLQQLASNRTNVRLKIADNSSDTLSEINY